MGEDYAKYKNDSISGGSQTKIILARILSPESLAAPILFGDSNSGLKQNISR